MSEGGGGRGYDCFSCTALYCAVDLYCIILTEFGQLSCFERGKVWGMFFSCCAYAIDLDFIVTEFG